MATSLAQAVKFRSLLGDLSKNEFLKLMSKVYDKYQHQLVGGALFKYLNDDDANDDLKFVNSEISKIILSRKSKPKQAIITNLDNLPPQIIGNVSSSFEAKDYFNFERTNRSIFIGCNTPNMLKELDLRDFKCTDYSAIDLSKYRSLKSLHVIIDKLTDLYFPSTARLSNLRELTLDNNTSTTLDLAKIVRLGNHDFIKFDNINKLSLEDVTHACSHNIGGLFSHFPNVEYLKLFNVSIDNEVFDGFADSLKNKWHLKGLDVAGDSRSFSNHFINLFGDQIHFLARSNRSRPMHDFCDVDFSNLRQVILGKADIKVINDVLKTAKNLEKFYLKFAIYRNGVPPEIVAKLDTVIPPIFEIESLREFGIVVRSDAISSAMKGIEAGLFKTKKIKRKQLKIRVVVFEPSSIDVSALAMSVERIMHRLYERHSSTFIGEFMFGLDFSFNINGTYTGNVLLKEIKDICRNFDVQQFGNSVTVTNKNCRMSGWRPLIGDKGSFVDHGWC